MSISSSSSTILSEFNVVLSNLPDGDFHTQAKVILISKRHLNPEDINYISALVNYLAPSNVQILFEGSSFGDHFPDIQDKSLIKEAKRWDSQCDIHEFELLNKEFYLILKEGVTLLSQFVDGISDLAARETFRNCAVAWVDRYEKAMQQEATLASKSFLDKSRKLIHTLNTELEKSSKKIIVIAERVHLIQSEQFKEEINQFYKSMMESSYPFVILERKDLPDDEDYTTQNFVSIFRGKISSIFNGKIYPLDQTKAKIEECHSKYQDGKLFESSVVTNDITQIFFPIVCLTQMSKEGALIEAELSK